MVVTKEVKTIYNVLDIDDSDKAFCEQIVKLAEDVIADKAVNSYYCGHRNELLLEFIEDIAEKGSLDLRSYR
jgi:hypothetical protein